MLNLARQISVPEDHIISGRTLAPLDQADISGRHLIRVNSAAEKPDGAFVAVRYKGFWYYIADNDFESKRVFSFIMILLSLTESVDHVGLPLVTIPSG